MSLLLPSAAAQWRLAEQTRRLKGNSDDFGGSSGVDVLRLVVSERFARSVVKRGLVACNAGIWRD